MRTCGSQDAWILDKLMGKLTKSLNNTLPDWEASVSVSVNTSSTLHTKLWHPSGLCTLPTGVYAAGWLSHNVFS